MKFTVKKDVFVKPLQLVSTPATGPAGANPAPVYSNVLLDVRQDHLRMVCVDERTEMEVTVGQISGVEPGATTVNAKMLLDSCKTADKGEVIAFEQKDGDPQVRVSSGNASVTLVSIDADHFPNVKNIKQIASFSISESVFRQVINSISFSMGDKDMRTFLNGMMLGMSGDQLILATTDAHRLSCRTLKLDEPGSLVQNASVESGDSNPGDGKTDLQVIIPRQSVLELSRLLSDSKEKIQVIVGLNNIKIVTPEFSYVTRLVDAKFPVFAQLFPRDSDLLCEVLVPCDLLRSAIQKVAVINSDNKVTNARASCYLTPGKFEIMFENNRRETARDSFQIAYQGDNRQFSINYNFVQQILGSCSQSYMNLRLAEKSAVFESPDNKPGSELRYIVMLIKN